MPSPLSRLTTKRNALSPSLLADEEVPELNDHLRTLRIVYPDHDVDLLRRSLETVSRESRLEYVANMLTGLPPARGAGALPTMPLEEWQLVRTPGYREATYRCLSKEFSALTKSSVKAVLAENNHDFSRSRQALTAIDNQSWRINVQRWLVRSFSGRSSNRKPDVLEKLLPTGSTELDTEIGALINAPKVAQQLRADAELADRLNEEEHRQTMELVECECCYADVTWDQICHCSALHYFCHECLRRTVVEDVYGQGRALDRAMGSVRCFSSSLDGPCDAVVPRDLLEHSLPKELLLAIDERFAKEAQDAFSADEILRCPFCSFAVFDVIERRGAPETLGLSPYLESVARWLLIIFACLCAILSPMLVVALFFFAPLLQIDDNTIRRLVHNPLSTWFDTTQGPEAGQQRRSPRFRCENPSCSRESCLQCGKEWIGMHDCASEEKDKKRLFIERALAEAVKRTCPQCHTSFVKESGCNKMTCRCGYKMCYLCRADVGVEQYEHFCRHFRDRPGSACQFCTKCLLFQDEKTDEVLRRTQAQAELDWEAKKKGGW